MLCLTLGFVSSPPASAEPAYTDPVKAYCMAQVPQKARAVCQRDANIEKARTAATYHCGDHPESKQATCITSRAKIYFRDTLAVRPAPTGSVTAFQKAFDKILAKDIEKTGGSLTVANPKVDTTKTVERSAIEVGDLPTVSANTASIKSILTIVFNIIGAFALLSIVACGLKYITAGGSTQKAEEARNGILYSLIGLIVAITAQAIVAFVVKSV